MSRLDDYLELIERERGSRPSEAMLADEIHRLRAGPPVWPWRWVAIATLPIVPLAVLAWALNSLVAIGGVCCLSATWAVGIHDLWWRRALSADLVLECAP